MMHFFILSVALARQLFGGGQGDLPNILSAPYELLALLVRSLVLWRYQVKYAQLLCRGLFWAQP
jgi:hypothetical protein